jgi:hypothetical protein
MADITIRFSEGWAWSWTAIEAIATVILIVGIIITILQIRESRKSTNAQIAMDLFRELRDEKVLEIIRFIYKLNPGESGCLLTVNNQRIEFILDRYDVLGTLVKNGIISKELAVETYAGVTVLRCWYILHGYIEKLRSTRKYFGQNFEGFTNVCMEYFDEHNIEVGFESGFSEDYSVDDLVDKLLNAENEKDPAINNLYPRTWEQIEKDFKKHKK